MELNTDSGNATNIIDLISSEASRITNVSLYSGRAEITRLFELEIKAGQNVVIITGLPRSLQENTIRVEGRGNASIHDVVTAKTERQPSKIPSLTDISTASPLVRVRKELRKELESARKSRASLDTYLTTINANDFDIARLESTLSGYSTLCKKVDNQILDLEAQLDEVTKRVKEVNSDSSDGFMPSWKVTINVNGKVNEMVEISVTYAVCSADWTPIYDIRVNTQDKEKSITIMYKAIITQATGESWDNVPMTLGTVSPSFGIKPPTLSSWFVYERTVPIAGVPMSGFPIQQPVIIQTSRRSRSRSRSRSRRRRRSPRARAYSPSGSVSSLDLPTYKPAMTQQPTVIPVSNKGDLAATFLVPGLITVPDNGGRHNVTIAELTVDAALMWYSIPAAERSVHLKAKIKNDSKYTFVPGTANIYVDGSFIGTTNLPSVGPHETFDCPLGIDHSIRVTYHPLEKKSAKSGFVSKTASRLFTQNITVQNTKATAIQNVKIIDRIPVSQDERIDVKLLNPALNPSARGSGGPSTQRDEMAMMRPVPVAQDIFAQWDGADGDFTSGVDQTGIGKNGKINWVLSIPPYNSVSLTLQFEVSHPESLAVPGI